MNWKIYQSGLVLTGLLIITSCSSDSTADQESGAAQEQCFYSYNEGATTLEWTSFKTNDKIPVKGGFNEIQVTSESSEDPKEVLESIKFKIATASVETNDTSRNRKVGAFFFETINTEFITGGISSIGENGKATITINMNGIDFDVEGAYKLEDRVFSWESSIDVSSWNGMSGINALNEACKDLHTGKDGESKLWSEVALKLTTVLDSGCD